MNPDPITPDQARLRNVCHKDTAVTDYVRVILCKIADQTSHPDHLTRFVFGAGSPTSDAAAAILRSKGWSVSRQSGTRDVHDCNCQMSYGCTHNSTAMPYDEYVVEW